MESVIPLREIDRARERFALAVRTLEGVFQERIWRDRQQKRAVRQVLIYNGEWGIPECLGPPITMLRIMLH